MLCGTVSGGPIVAKVRILVKLSQRGFLLTHHVLSAKRPLSFAIFNDNISQSAFLQAFRLNGPVKNSKREFPSGGCNEFNLLLDAKHS